MSHIATITTEFKDIQAVKALCAEMGWTFKENQEKYLCFEHEYPGYSKRNGFELPADWGKCAHAIKFPNCHWELGLVKTTSGYRLAGDDLLFQDDAWTPSGSEVGMNYGKFAQGYAKHKLMLEAKRRGKSVRTEKLHNGSIRLRISA